MWQKAKEDITSFSIIPEDALEKRPDALKTSSYGPIFNAKGRIHCGTFLGRTQDADLTPIYKMGFNGVSSVIWSYLAHF